MPPLPTPQYYRQAAEIGSAVFSELSDMNLDEQAGPAYFAGNYFSRKLFWHRLNIALRNSQTQQADRCLDFGCGFGLLLPYLQSRYTEVIGMDLVPTPARRFLQRWYSEETSAIHPTVVDSLEGPTLAAGSFDLILALDVLEHVESIQEYARRFAQLLKPSGVLVISGPTETWLYKLGRAIVGFSGDYHVCNVQNVFKEVGRELNLEIVSRLPRVISLFEFARATPSQTTYPSPNR